MLGKGLFQAFERLFSRQFGMMANVVFMLTTLFASFESVPGWGFFEWDVNYNTWLAIVAVTGMVCGFIAAERRFAGAIALAICGAGAFGVVGTLLSAVPALPMWNVLIVMVIGCLPGMAIYWLVERLLGRPKEFEAGASMSMSSEQEKEQEKWFS